MLPPDLLLTRRHFFRDCGVGIGSAALATLLSRDLPAAAPPPPVADAPGSPLAARPGHFKAKARSVIVLWMAGGVTHGRARSVLRAKHARGNVSAA